MSTAIQQQANRSNSQLSTGPVSRTGKRTVSKNATKFGFWTREIVLPGESRDDWQAFRAGLVESLNPVGTAEVALAEQISEILWRQQRIAAVESAIARMPPPPPEYDVNPSGSPFQAPEPVESGPDLPSLHRKLAYVRNEQKECQWFLELLAELPEHPDDEIFDGQAAERIFERFDVYSEVGLGELHFGHSNQEILEAISLPEEFRNNLARWPEWTAGRIRLMLQQFAVRQQMSFEEMCQQAQQGYRWKLAAAKESEESLQLAISQWQSNEDARRLNAHLQRLFLQGDELERLHRAEAHLNRILRQRMHLLQDLQSVRRSRPARGEGVEPIVVTIREPVVPNRLEAEHRNRSRTSESHSVRMC